MADSYLGYQNPGTVDKKLDSESLTVGAETVERERVQIAGSAAAEIADVHNSPPAGTEYGIIVRPIPSGVQNIAAADVLANGNITTQNLVPAGAATAGSAVLSGQLNGQTTLIVQVTGTYTGALSLQGTVDGTNWITIGGLVFLNVNTGGYLATITSALVGIFQADCVGFSQIRVTGLAAMTGTAVVTMRATTGAGFVAIDAALPAGTNEIGGVNVSKINGVAPLMGAGNTGTGSPRVTIATDQAAVSTKGATAADTAISNAPVTVGGRASDAAPTAMTADGDVVNMWLDRKGRTVVAGQIAHDSADEGNPVKVGAKAYAFDGTAPGTAVAEGDVANMICDPEGRLYINEVHPNFWSAYANYSSAQTNISLKAAPGAGLSLYITDIIISNGATAGTVKLIEDPAGTPADKIPVLYLAANGGAVINFKTPIKLTANKALGFTSAAVTTHSIVINGFIAA